MNEMIYNNSGKDEMMKQIRELTFAAVDLNLYLDNHPENQKAVCDYNIFTERLMEFKKAYEMNHGSLTNFGHSPSHYPWTWINEPWPWESGL
jgi:spore coat protein JB